MLARILASFAFVLSAVCLPAQGVVQWIGGEAGSPRNWSTSSNWKSGKSGGPPDSDSTLRNAVIGESDDSCFVDVSRECATLWVEDGAELEIPPGVTLTVSGNLVVLGRLFGGGTLVLQDPVSMPASVSFAKIAYLGGDSDTSGCVIHINGRATDVWSLGTPGTVVDNTTAAPNPTTMWTGAGNDCWSSDDNWSDGAPDENTTAIIVAGTDTPIVDTTTLCANLIVRAGATVQVLAPNRKLRVAGNFVLESDASDTASPAAITTDGNGFLALVEQYVGTGSDATHARVGICQPGTQIANVIFEPHPGFERAGDYLCLDLTVAGEMRGGAYCRDSSCYGSGSFGDDLYCSGVSSFDCVTVEIGSSQGNLLFEPTGSLSVVDTLFLGWTMEIPGEISIGTLEMSQTSTVRPTTGVVRIRPGSTLAVDHKGDSGVNWSSRRIEVEAGGSFEFKDALGGGDHEIGEIVANGPVRIEMEFDEDDFSTPTMSIGKFSAAAESTLMTTVGENDDETPTITIGEFEVGADTTLIGNIEVDTPTVTSLVAGLTTESTIVVQTGAKLRLGMSEPAIGDVTPTDVTVKGQIDVLGELELLESTTLEFARYDLSRITVAPGGRLRLAGQPNEQVDDDKHAKIQCADDRVLAVFVDGDFIGEHFDVLDLGPSGFVWRGSGDHSVLDGKFEQANFAGGTSLVAPAIVDMQRTVPTVMRRVEFSGPASSFAIRSFLEAVSTLIVGASGPQGSEAFEDDPNAVISWTDGITYHGHSTDGCTGLAENRANSVPRIGNLGFKLQLDGGPPNRTAIQVLGFGRTDPLQASLFGFPIDFWIYMNNSFVLIGSTDVNGLAEFALPLPDQDVLVDCELWCQVLVDDRSGCPTQGISTSTAIRLLVLPAVD